LDMTIFSCEFEGEDTFVEVIKDISSSYLLFVVKKGKIKKER